MIKIKRVYEQKNKEDTVTFVYAAHNEKNNNALALKMFFESS